MFIQFPTTPQSTDWYQCQPHRSIKRIFLLPQWFMKIITPTLTRFPKKSACSSTLAKHSVCALGETGADMVLWNRTGNTETCGGHRAHAISLRIIFMLLDWAEAAAQWGLMALPTLSHLLPWGIQRDGMKSSATEKLLALSPALSQDFTKKNHLYTAGTQTLPTTPNISVCLTHSHILSFFLLAGDTLSRRLCITVIHLLLKYWVAFRVWHFELSGGRMLLSQQTLKSVSWTH